VRLWQENLAQNCTSCIHRGHLIRVAIPEEKVGNGRLLTSGEQVINVGTWPARMCRSRDHLKPKGDWIHQHDANFQTSGDA
jgi:hypothetical protein